MRQPRKGGAADGPLEALWGRSDGRSPPPSRAPAGGGTVGERSAAGRRVGRVVRRRLYRSPRPWIARSPIHPHWLPPRARAALRHLLAWAAPGRLRAWPGRETSFPWPAGGARTRRLAAADESAGRPAWPGVSPFALCLSHDVDTARGQRRAAQLAAIEERLGFRSAWFLSPGNYRLDHGLWRDLAARGHEIACHGWAHDFKLPWLPRRAIAERLDRALDALAPYGPVGFRSPGLLRSPRLWREVRRRFDYDSSAPDTLRLHGPDGCGVVRPFAAAGCVEVPITLPYDGELIALGFSPRRQLALWRDKVCWIVARGGLVHVLTHPDPQFTADRRRRLAYQQLLAWLADRPDPPWLALPRDAARWAAVGEAGAAAAPAEPPAFPVERPVPGAAPAASFPPPVTWSAPAPL